MATWKKVGSLASTAASGGGMLPGSVVRRADFTTSTGTATRNMISSVSANGDVYATQLQRQLVMLREADVSITFKASAPQGTSVVVNVSSPSVYFDTGQSASPVSVQMVSSAMTCPTCQSSTMSLVSVSDMGTYVAISFKTTAAISAGSKVTAHVF